jgi:transcriptional regulator with XRE-family HTH domain
MERIRAAREAAGLSQAQLGRLMVPPLSRLAVWRLENGARALTAAHVEAFAAALALSVSELYGEPCAAAARELAELRAVLEQPTSGASVAGICPGAPLREHVTRLLARLRFDHDEKCSVVVVHLRQARESLTKLRASLRAACDEIAEHNSSASYVTTKARVATWRAESEAA